MRFVLSKRALIATVIVATAGCAGINRGSPASLTTCFPKQCLLEVDNYADRFVSVRYYDSTGVGDVLGLARDGVTHFSLSRRTSRAVVVEVESDGRLYRVRRMISAQPYENILRFPDDFEVVRTR